MAKHNILPSNRIMDTHYSELGYNVCERSVNRFSENVYELFIWSKRKNAKQICLKPLTNHMAIDINMLGVFMEARVVRYMMGNLVVAIENGRCWRLDVKVLKEIVNPLKLTGSSGESTILYFEGWMGNCILFFRLPWN